MSSALPTTSSRPQPTSAARTPTAGDAIIPTSNSSTACTPMPAAPKPKFGSSKTKANTTGWSGLRSILRRVTPLRGTTPSRTVAKIPTPPQYARPSWPQTCSTLGSCQTNSLGKWPTYCCRPRTGVMPSTRAWPTSSGRRSRLAQHWTKRASNSPTLLPCGARRRPGGWRGGCVAGRTRPGLSPQNRRGVRACLVVGGHPLISLKSAGGAPKRHGPDVYRSPAQLVMQGSDTASQLFLTSPGHLTC